MPNLPWPSPDVFARAENAGRDGLPWGLTAAMVGLEPLRAHSAVSCHQHEMRLMCAWIQKDTPSPNLDPLNHQRDQVKARWLALHPGATLDDYSGIVALFEAWQRGHAHHVVRFSDALHEARQKQPGSVTLLRLFYQLVRQQERPHIPPKIRMPAELRQPSAPATKPEPPKRPAPPLAPPLASPASPNTQSIKATISATQRFQKLMGMQGSA